MGSLQLSEEIYFKQELIQIKRRSRRRTMTIQIAPHKGIIVLTSLSVSKSKIEDFLKERWSWVLKSKEEVHKLEQNNPTKQFLDGEKFFYLGDEKTLRYKLTTLKRSFVAIEDTELGVYLPASLWKKGEAEFNALTTALLIRKYYQSRAQELLPLRLEQLAQWTGLRPSQVKIRNAKTRWGSCSSNGRLMLNWRLIVAPPHVIDYVIIHELCHLKWHNHGKNFWSLVEFYLPEYQKAERWLKSHHLTAEF